MQFEGEDIDGFSIQIRQFKGPLDMPLVRGEKVQLTIVGEVVEVSIWENRRNGQVFRKHVVVVDEVVG